MNHQSENALLRLGTPLPEARGALVMLHGRGSSGRDIAQLADVLHGEGLAFLAPTAAENSWYPRRFIAELRLNEPALSQAFRTIDTLLAEVEAAGIPAERTGLLGFSQGACLSAEHLSRNPRKLGLVAALSGALIGPMDTDHSGLSLEQTPVLLACAERDAHIPLEHVERSASLLARRDAQVTKLIFPGSAHTVFQEEIDWLNEQLETWR